MLTNVAVGVVYAQEARHIEKIKESVHKLGTGKDARVEMKLQDGRKVKGYIRDELCLKSPKSFLDTVSTGSGSDLVSDQHPTFPNDS